MVRYIQTRTLSGLTGTTIATTINDMKLMKFKSLKVNNGFLWELEDARTLMTRKYWNNIDKFNDFVNSNDDWIL